MEVCHVRKKKYLNKNHRKHLNKDHPLKTDCLKLNAIHFRYFEMIGFLIFYSKTLLHLNFLLFW